MTEGWAHLLSLPGRHLEWRAEGKRPSGSLGTSVSGGCWRTKGARNAPSTRALCLLGEDKYFASRTLNSADTGTDLVRSLVNAGYESCVCRYHS